MARTSPTQAAIASSYTLWCEYFDTLGIDSREDFDAMLHSEKMEMLAFGFGNEDEIETAPPMTPERAAEVQTMYDKAQAGAAIVKAVACWRSAMAGMNNWDIDDALNAVWNAGETYDSLCNKAY